MRNSLAKNSLVHPLLLLVARNSLARSSLLKNSLVLRFLLLLLLLVLENRFAHQLLHRCHRKRLLVQRRVKFLPHPSHLRVRSLVHLHPEWILLLLVVVVVENRFAHQLLHRYHRKRLLVQRRVKFLPHPSHLRVRSLVHLHPEWILLLLLLPRSPVKCPNRRLSFHRALIHLRLRHQCRYLRRLQQDRASPALLLPPSPDRQSDLTPHPSTVLREHLLVADRPRLPRPASRAHRPVPDQQLARQIHTRQYLGTRRLQDVPLVAAVSRWFFERC